MFFLHRPLLFIIMALILSSCSNNQPPIPKNTSIAATINIRDMTVSFIDLRKMEKITEWELKKPYIGGIIFPDNDSLLLYGKQIDTADLYSLKTGKIIDSWEIGGGIVNGKLLKNNTEVALVDQKQNKIRFFDLKGQEKASVTTAINPLTLLEAEGPWLYVLSFDHKSLTVIESKKKKIVKEYPIHSLAAGSWLIENQDELWIGGHGEGPVVEKYIHVYDTKTGALKKKIPAPSMPVNFIGYNQKVFVLSHGSSKLYKMNENGNVLTSMKIGANPFEMVKTNNGLLVAGYDSNELYFVDPVKMKVKKTIKVGNGPFQIVLRERGK